MSERRWPDPPRPGVPLNPERDGWHWLESPRKFVRPCLWNPRSKTWLERGSIDDMTRAGWRYIGPCLSPSEVAAAVQAEREACAHIAQNRESEGGEYALAARHIAAAIRARSAKP